MTLRVTWCGELPGIWCPALTALYAILLVAMAVAFVAAARMACLYYQYKLINTTRQRDESSGNDGDGTG